VVLAFFERYFPDVQATNVLFGCGCLLALVQAENTRHIFGDFFQAVDMWEHITPHMLFSVFLPVLIFGEAMQFNTSMFKRTFWQIVLLACPGVLIGTALTAVFAMYVLPYPWSWPVALAFGAILSATDPVAVVGLFKTLGVSQTLTMVVSGESVLNDGTGICAFTLMMQLVKGQPVTVGSIALFFLNMCGVSTLVGGAFGLATCIVVGACAHGHYASDSMIQFLVTLSCAFLTYFVVDVECSSSGVIGAMSAGLVVSHYAWPRFVSKEANLLVWEALLFVANTVIFFLAGMLFTNICLTRRSDITIADFGYLFLLYGALHVIRGLMIMMLWVPLNLVGQPFTWQEGFVMMFSGLRGAVSLMMAISFDIESRKESGFKQVHGSRVMFHVGGMAVLTMFVNSALTPGLLRFFELTKVSQVQRMVLDNFQLKMQAELKEKAKTLGTSDDIRFSNVQLSLVQALVPDLADTPKPLDFPEAEIVLSKASNPSEKDQNAMLCIYRELFLKAVAHCYWSMVEEGILTRNMHVTHILLQSCDEALCNAKTVLCDWDCINKYIDSILHPTAFASMMSSVSKTGGFKSLANSWLRNTWDLDVNLERLACALLCYQEAHAQARKQAPQFFSKCALTTATATKVNAESTQMCEGAEAFMREHIKEEMIQIEKAKLVAQKLLQHKLHKVHHLKEQGMLSQMEASLLTNDTVEASSRVTHSTFFGVMSTEPK